MTMEKKHIGHAGLIILFLFSVLPCLAQDDSDGFISDGMEYVITSEEENTVQLVDASGKYAWDYSGEITIPTTVLYGNKTYTVTSIGWAFTGFHKEITVSIPSTVTELQGTFVDSYGLKTIELPNSLKIIGEMTFYDTGLTSIVIPPSVTEIGQDAFSWTFIDSIVIPKNVSRIDAPLGTLFKSISVEEGNPVYDSRNGCNAVIETATNKLLSGCKNTVIPEGVVTIGTCAFKGCENSSLIWQSAFSLEIPRSVTTIEERAFESAWLSSIFIPRQLTTIGDGAFSGATFDPDLTITVEEGNPVYDSREGCNALIETSKNAILSGCAKTKFVPSVSSIAFNAFSGCYIESLDIPGNIKTIGPFAFSYCHYLKNLKIQEGVDSIMTCAFSSCRSIVNLNVAEGLDYIALDAFSDAFDTRNAKTPLHNGKYFFTLPQGYMTDYYKQQRQDYGEVRYKSYHIPDGIETICVDALRDALWGNSLDTLYIPSSMNNIGVHGDFGRLKTVYCFCDEPPVIGDKWLMWPLSGDGNTMLYVPEPALEKYRSSTQWINFKEILPIPDELFGSIPGIQAKDTGVSAIYGPDGRMRNEPMHGINILRLNSGGMRKVLIK